MKAVLLIGLVLVFLLLLARLWRTGRRSGRRRGAAGGDSGAGVWVPGATASPSGKHHSHRDRENSSAEGSDGGGGGGDGGD